MATKPFHLHQFAVAFLATLFALSSCSQPQTTSLEIGTPTAQITPLEIETPAAGSFTQTELESIFEISSKEAGTQLYFSPSLGVGFTYLAWPESPSFNVVETGNVISILDQQVEVFTKDPADSLQQAIEKMFLQSYDPADCFVVPKEPTEQGLAGYVAAEISYPKPEGDDSAWWANAEKCPANYSQTNGMQYFLMNEAVPGTFIFVRIGQYFAAKDGTPAQANGDVFNWTHSIRIVK